MKSTCPFQAKENGKNPDASGGLEINEPAPGTEKGLHNRLTNDGSNKEPSASNIEVVPDSAQ